ncbi:MAG: alanine dehydrogenase [Oscillospiraceae bacterium]|nr:alanine dehydrogenase [Oscillospiraceae bacterium]
MIIGCPTEIKAQEGRVGVTPAMADAFRQAGHTVYIQQGAGINSGFPDAEYVAAGAQLLPTAKEVFDKSDMIIKVKEPLEAEYDLFHEGQILFTYLHLAPDPEQTEALLRKKVIGIAYETVQLPNGALPLLSCMSEIAGRMAVQVGAHLLESTCGGRGILLYGVSGVEKGNVVIIGGGTVGTSAVKIAVGMGANVTVIDMNAQRLAYLDDIFGSRIQTLISNSYNIARAVENADVVIGCVLVPGAKTPVLVTNEMVAKMRRGSVLIDVAIDQGGSIEAIDRITTHADPYYTKEDGIIRYSVANMPGAVPRTSTLALTNVTLPYALKIANLGAEGACKADPALMKGLNVYKGKLTFKSVAEAQGLEYTDPATLF